MLVFKTMLRKYNVTIYNREMIRFDFQIKSQYFIRALAPVMYYYAKLKTNNFLVVDGTQKYQINMPKEQSIIFIDDFHKIQE